MKVYKTRSDGDHVILFQKDLNRKSAGKIYPLPGSTLLVDLRTHTATKYSVTHLQGAACSTLVEGNTLWNIYMLNDTV